MTQFLGLSSDLENLILLVWILSRVFGFLDGWLGSLLQSPGQRQQSRRSRREGGIWTPPGEGGDEQGGLRMRHFSFGWGVRFKIRTPVKHLH